MIRIGVYGLGNLGKGVLMALRQNADMELVGVFTRRDPASVDAGGAPVYSASAAADFRGKIDVMILCGGSATDLPQQGPQVAAMFTTVDSFDTHADIPAYFAAVDTAAKQGGNISIISVGWDPGLFSLNRLYARAILPDGVDYTFWGPGVSQGHSDALRRIPGVENAIQYTLPVESALDSIRAGQTPQLTARQKHTRLCYVVAKEGADKAEIERAIVTMPKYFDEYDVTVKFVSREELAREHSRLSHGGFVLRSGRTGADGKSSQLIEYSLKLDSNPEFTSSVLVAYARAAFRLSQKGESGARTVFDIAPALLCPQTPGELRATML